MLEYKCVSVPNSLKCFNLSIDKGSIGILGERDSGKESVIPITLGLIRNVTGEILLDGVDMIKSRDLLFTIRWTKISAVFYDPRTMFDPLYSIGSHFAEIVISHGIGDYEYGIETGLEYMKILGLERDLLDKLPHQLTPIQLKKASIALATFLEPSYVIVDDIEFGLGDIGRAAVMNSLIDLMNSVSSSFIFLENNPGILSRLTDNVIVLYKGEIVEEGKNVLLNPLHPYTIDLIRGDVPDEKIEGKGCPYSTHCRYSTSKCEQEVPWIERGSRRVRCLAHVCGL
ncbi:ATP-binding cassette domain-containing protein [Metallosphaera cuprina]|uniref:ABC transporter related protein n=1 Tax=Metallosphaera cuprina (strain Ar-4) TaxID=1006006 RepID=F4G2B0_METCR|nr:ATP-binding cassette domain-containing protein [Metallosphaera cuprina]AEB94958.1 ABC transporter related protein [Metallosphaera cuprina Ar-4]